MNEEMTRPSALQRVQLNAGQTWSAWKEGRGNQGGSEVKWGICEGCACVCVRVCVRVCEREREREREEKKKIV